MEAIDSFWRTGRATITKYPNAAIGISGDAYSRAEVGVKLQGLCGFAAGKLVDRAIPMSAALSAALVDWAHVGAVLSNAVVTAATVVAAMRILVLIGLSVGVAAPMAVIAVVASPLLEVSRHLISTNGSVFGLVLALCGLLELFQSIGSARQRAMLAVNVVGFGFATILTMRATGVLFLPVLGGVFLWVEMRNRTDRARHFAILTMWCLVGLSLKLGYNYHRFGGLLATGYQGEVDTYFTRSVVLSTFASLLVPRWSILANSPLTLVGLACLMRFIWSKQRIGQLDGRRFVVPLLILLIVPHWIVYAMYIAPQFFVTRYLAEPIVVLNLLGSAWIGLALQKRNFSATGTAGLCLASLGIVNHLFMAVIAPARAGYQFQTQATPPSWASTLDAMWVPMESVEAARALIRFPRPDWLVTYMQPSIPASLWALLACVVAIALLLGVSVPGALWKRNLQCAAFAFVLPTVALLLALNWRTSIAEASVPRYAVGEGIARVSGFGLYRVGDSLAMDLLCENPRVGDAAPDKWLKAPYVRLEIQYAEAGQQYRHVTVLGRPFYRSYSDSMDTLSYMYHAPIWLALDEPETQAPLGLALTRVISAQLLIDTGLGKPETIPLQEMEYPSTRQARLERLKNRILIPSSEFLTSPYHNESARPVVLGHRDRSFVVPASMLRNVPLWKRVELRFRCTSSGIGDATFFRAGIGNSSAVAKLENEGTYTVPLTIGPRSQEHSPMVVASLDSDTTTAAIEVISCEIRIP